MAFRAALRLRLRYRRLAVGAAGSLSFGVAFCGRRLWWPDVSVDGVLLSPLSVWLGILAC